MKQINKCQLYPFRLQVGQIEPMCSSQVATHSSQLSAWFSMFSGGVQTSEVNCSFVQLVVHREKLSLRAVSIPCGKERDLAFPKHA